MACPLFRLSLQSCLEIAMIWYKAIIPRTGIAILWLALHQQEFDSIAATSLVEAAGVKGRQRWHLFSQGVLGSCKSHMKQLSQSATLNLTVKAEDVHFDTYLVDQQARVGGFLPIVWKASHSPVYASADLGLIVEWTSAKFTLTERRKFVRGCIAQMDVLLSRPDSVKRCHLVCRYDS